MIRFVEICAILLLVASTAASFDTNGIQYLVVMDAGSTGTRCYVFKFMLDSRHSTGLRLMEVQQRSTRPGLSAFRNFPSRAADSVAGLLRFAESSVPASYHGNTTAIVRATAGLRLLDAASRKRVEKSVTSALRASAFVVPEAAVRVISGTEEAAFGWVAVNFLLDAFGRADSDTFGVLDLGGGSTQITFVPDADLAGGDPNRVRFRTVHNRAYALHQHSYLGLGMSAATLKMIGYSGLQRGRLRSPCLSPDFSDTFAFGDVRANVSGSPEVLPSRRIDACVATSSRAFADVHMHSPPGLDGAKFVAVSSFYYVVKMAVRQLPDLAKSVPGNFTVGFFAEAASRICPNPPTTGKYKPYLCLSLVYIDSLLRHGYKFKPEQTLLVTRDIGGHSASWPLGLAIHHLTCSSQGGCLEQRVRAEGGGVDTPCVVTLVQLLLPLVLSLML